MSVYSDTALDDECILVTGATGGIGKATAQLLGGMGASLVLTGRDETKLENVSATVEDSATTGRVVSYPADITEQSERGALLETARSETSGVTMLVNSAGMGGGRIPFEDLKPDRITNVMNLNYTATVLLTQAVYRRLKERNGGAIVNVSSLSGLRGTYRSIPYCASKFAVTGFTQALALEAIEHNIRVNAVSPGWVDTEMARRGIESKAKAKGRTFEEQREIEVGSLPSGRMTTPDEVANAIAFLLTPGAANIVGESVKISGGTLMR